MKRRPEKMLLLALMLLFGLLSAMAPRAIFAQQGGTTHYVYDDNGRLRAVIAPNGEANVYEYDAAGNITAIRRLSADALALLNFAPKVGFWGDQVTFWGPGIGTATSVSFNGVTATIVEVNPAYVIAKVPQGATSGTVTITTPRGTISTDQPFIVKGLQITPSAVSLSPGQTQQFTARLLPEDFDQSVKWSVNGIEGGNASVGTISASGLYTAPSSLLSGITVRATSVAEPELFGEASVMVGVLDASRTIGSAAAAVSVGRESLPAPTPTIAAASAAVSVGRESLPAPPLMIAAVSASVAVGRDVPPTPPANMVAAVSAGVSVGRESAPGLPLAIAAISAGVSVGRETLQSAALPVAAVSAGVSATSGPHISSMSPNRIARGATNVVITISGENLNGVTAVRFIAENGTLETSITVTNVTSNANGTALTATLAVGSNAALGRRLVVVSTATRNSQAVNTGANSIEIIP